MYLTKEEEKVLEGEEGEAKAFAMKVLVNLGDLEDSDRLVPIVSAHVSGVSYHTAGEALIKLLEDLNEKGARISIPTSLNPAGMDLELWEQIGYPEEFAQKQMRIIDLYSKLGINMTCSCIPYETPQSVQPIKMGDHLSWGESNAVIYANSMVGARTNREGGISSLASAILGKTPDWGMHQDDPRMPTMEVQVEGEMKIHHYDLLGAYIGKNYNSQVAVYKGLPKKIDHGALKHLGASMAAKGGHPIFHIEGITPEQTLVQRAFDEKAISEKITITEKELEDLKVDLYPSPTDEFDIFVLGCPQFGMAEFERLHEGIKGKKIKQGKRIIVYTNRSLLDRIEENMLKEISRSGIEIYNDTCMVVTPLKMIGIDRVGTDSGKAAHYIPKMSKAETGLFPLEMIIDLCML
jgi:predicted aconitase